jgi:hypothetical protein
MGKARRKIRRKIKRKRKRKTKLSAPLESRAVVRRPVLMLHFAARAHEYDRPHAHHCVARQRLRRCGSAPNITHGIDDISRRSADARRGMARISTCHGTQSRNRHYCGFRSQLFPTLGNRLSIWRSLRRTNVVAGQQPRNGLAMYAKSLIYRRRDIRRPGVGRVLSEIRSGWMQRCRRWRARHRFHVEWFDQHRASLSCDL